MSESLEKTRYFDVTKFTEDFLEGADWRARENANVPFSFSSLFFRGAGEVVERYLLAKVYPPEVARAHVEGDIHIHNLYMGMVGYCAGWSLRQLLLRGLGGVPFRLNSAPPRHLTTAVHQMVNFVGVIQNEWSGAQAFNSVDTLLAPFVRKDRLDYRQTKQAIQEFVFGLNVTARWGGQSPFTNVTLDWTVPDDLADEPVIVGGEYGRGTYADYQDEVDMINRAFIEVMIEGDAAGRIFTFPIPTYNITKNFAWDSENAELLFEMCAKYGTPYFQNFVKSGLDPREVRAMCLHPNEEVIVRDGGDVLRMSIGDVVERYAEDFDGDGWSQPKRDLSVLSINPETFRAEWKRITQFLRSECNELVQVTTTDGKAVRVTPDHPIPILTPEGLRLKPAGDVRSGDVMLSLRSGADALNCSYQEIKLLRRGFKLLNSQLRKRGLGLSDSDVAKVVGAHKDAVGRRRRRLGLEPNESKPIDEEEALRLRKETAGYERLVLNEELGAFLGFFTSEGNYIFESRRSLSTYRSPKGIRLTFRKGGVSLRHRIRGLIKRILKVEPKERKDSRRDVYYLYIYSSDVARALYYAGFRNHGRLPNILFSSPPSVISAFLDYFFLGNGYGRRRGIHTNDEALARDIAILSSLVGRPTCYRKGISGQTIYMRRGAASGQTSIAPATCELPPGWTAKSTYLIPGLNKKNVVDVRTLKTYGAFTAEAEKLAYNAAAPIKVKSIERIKLESPQAFYDLELEANHLFVHSLGTITHNCCRLRLDLRQLYRRYGGYFGFADQTGSVGVVTINMPRIGYLSKEEDEFFERLERTMDLAKESLEIKRKVVQKNLDRGLLPYTKRYLGNLTWHFSTIGLVGMNEACINFLREGIASDVGREFAIKVLRFMRDKVLEYQEETGNAYNLEATPAEGCSYRLAALDKQKYPDIVTAGEKVPYYTSSTHLPVNYTDDLFFALRHQEDLQALYTGGTVFHVFLGERIDAEACRLLVRKIVDTFSLPYFTITPTFSVCSDHGYIWGEHFTCPTCGKEAEVYSRVVGYFRPVQSWNAGKREEFRQRSSYKVKEYSQS